MKICFILFTFSISALIFDYILLKKVYKEYEKLKKERAEPNE